MGSMLNLTGALTGGAPAPFLFGGVQIRVVIDDDGGPWFVAQDVCTVLGLGAEQTRRLDDDEKGLRSVQTPGGEQMMMAVNESGLYVLVLGSRKPQARAFKKWVTSEVLPALRKTGTYTVGAAPALPNFMDPVAAARAWADSEEQKQRLQVELEVAAPAVEFVQRYADSTGTKGFRQVAKLLGANENQFREFLLDQKIMYRLGRELTPHSQHIDAGRFCVKAGTAQVSGHAYNAARFTPKGVTWVAGEWGKWKVRQQGGEVGHG